MQDALAVAQFATLISLFIVFLSCFIWQSNRDVPGVNNWILAIFLVFLYSAMITGNAMLIHSGFSPPKFLLYVIPNVVVFSGIYHVGLGFSYFFNCYCVLIRLKNVFFITLILGLLFSTYIIDSMLFRMALVRIAVISVYLFVAHMLLSKVAKPYKLGRALGLSALLLSSFSLISVMATISWENLSFYGKELFFKSTFPHILGFQLVFSFCFSLICIERKNFRLEKLTLTDPLTGVLNRRGWHKATQSHFKAHAPAVLVCDLDYFKQLNDQHGHMVGDKALVAVSQLLKQQLGEVAIARMGGEEFAIYLADCNQRQAKDLAEKLRLEIESCEMKLDDRKVKVTASFGIYSGSADQPVDHFLERADRALYQAKLKGRNRVELYSGEDDSPLLASA